MGSRAYLTVRCQHEDTTTSAQETKLPNQQELTHMHNCKMFGKRLFANKQAEGNADMLIVSIALEISNPVLVAADTDILAMLVNQTSGTYGGVYMGRGLSSCVNVLDILEKIGTLMTYHVASGCNIVSELYSAWARRPCRIT